MKLKSNKVLVPLLSSQLIITIITAALLSFIGINWNSFDYMMSDWLYEYAITNGKGPAVSDKIIHLNISDNTYNYLKKNTLDRTFLSEANNALSLLSPNACMYDLLFVRESDKISDSLFAQSISNAGIIYLPAGFQLNNDEKKFRWEEKIFFERLKSEYLFNPIQLNSGSPYYASYAVAQNDIFASETFSSGHISAIPDADGVYRHYPLLIKIDSLFFPTVTLNMFLHYVDVPLDSIIVDWGNELIIPKTEDSFLDDTIHIPIDKQGSCFIPYPYSWKSAPKRMEIQNLIELSKDEENLDELLEYYEGNFVFIGDISTGIADLGHTPLEKDVPLVAIHSALMNSFLTNSFYSELSNTTLFFIILFCGLLIAVCLVPKSNIFIYLCGGILILLLGLFSYISLTHFLIIPIFTIATSILLIGAGSIITMHLISTKQEKFIRDAFSKYLPKKIVDELVEKPELLQLGGEEKCLTILFSDIAGFTSISESLKPHDMVELLNEYLTKMTDIIFEHEGIIDKYIGDAILAEFGAPIPIDNHADKAVIAALNMKSELSRLNIEWEHKYKHKLNSRFGINSGNVIIGNMGSRQMFDYTVIGDHVNLAARLESANKFYDTSIMISEFTYNQINKELFLIRPLDLIKVKGKKNAVKVFEVYGFKNDSLSNELQEYYQLFSNGFEDYLKSNFENAEKMFNQCLMLLPNDKASIEFLQRIEYFKNHPVPQDWDGSFELKSK